MRPVIPSRPPVTPAGYLDYGVNAILLGTEFTIMHSYRAMFLLASLVLLGACLMFNLSRMGGMRRPDFRFGPAALAGLALLLVNLSIVSFQTLTTGGFAAGVKMFVNEFSFMAMLFVCVWRYAPRYLHATLITVAVGIAWFSAINVVADRLGIGIELLSDRVTTFESRFEVGTYRWQAPLYSSWQLSGLVRWGVPLMLVHLWRYSRHRWTDTTLVGLSIAVSLLVLILCEYRAAIFPLAGAVLWLAIPSNRLRILLNLGFLVYSVLVPLVITQAWVGQFLQDRMPASILQLAGNQDILGVLTLSGRSVMWQSGLDVLAEGKYLWLGQGHVLMNAAKDIGGQDAASAQLFQRIGFHQGVLDLLFIYGVVPASLLLAGVFYGVLRGARAVFRRNIAPLEVDEISFAIFSLGMIALSNCHDGFFLEHNVFYFLIIISLCAISDSVRRADPSNRQDVRVPQKPPLRVPHVLN